MVTYIPVLLLLAMLHTWIWWSKNLRSLVYGIQLILPSFSDTFVGEAKLMHQLHHPRIVQILGVCTEPPGSPIYIITELMSKGALLNFLREEEGQRLVLQDMLLMLSQVCRRFVLFTIYTPVVLIFVSEDITRCRHSWLPCYLDKVYRYYLYCFAAWSCTTYCFCVICRWALLGKWPFHHSLNLVHASNDRFCLLHIFLVHTISKSTWNLETCWNDIWIMMDNREESRKWVIRKR